MTCFGINPLGEESRVSDWHGALDCSSCVLLLSILFVPAFANSFHSHTPLLQQPTLPDLSRMWPHLTTTA